MRLSALVAVACVAFAAPAAAGAAAPSIPLEQWKLENAPSVLAPADNAGVFLDEGFGPEFAWVTRPGTRDRIVLIPEDIVGEVSLDPFDGSGTFSSVSVDPATGVAKATLRSLKRGRYFWHITRNAIGDGRYEVESLDRALAVVQWRLKRVYVSAEPRRGSSTLSPGRTVLSIGAVPYAAGTLTLRRKGRVSKRALPRSASPDRSITVRWSCADPGGSYSYTVSMHDDAGVTKQARGRFHAGSSARCRSMRAAERRARSLPQKLTLALAEARTIRVMREQLGGGAEYEARVGCTRLTRYAARCRFTSFAGDVSWRGHVRIISRAERWDWTLTGARTDEYHGGSEALNASGSH